MVGQGKGEAICIYQLRAWKWGRWENKLWWKEKWMDRISLAMIDNYHLTRKNATFRFVILHRHPWGGRFRVLKIEGGQNTGEKDRNPSGQEADYPLNMEVFGSVISS